MKSVIQSLTDFALSKSTPKGWYAGNGSDFWVRCADEQAAYDTGEKYIFYFLNESNITCYKA